MIGPARNRERHAHAEVKLREDVKPACSQGAAKRLSAFSSSAFRPKRRGRASAKRADEDYFAFGSAIFTSSRIFSQEDHPSYLALMLMTFLAISILWFMISRSARGR
jgi:hypothetical protein